jgi:hypothetical protein
MRRKLLTTKEAAAMLNMPLRTFQENHRGLGLIPIDLGGLPTTRRRRDGSTYETITKSQWRFVESEVEKVVEMRLQARFKQAARANQAIRSALDRATG